MRPSAYDMPGLHEQFQYYDDGRLKQMTDLDDRHQDIGFSQTQRAISVVLRSYDVKLGRLTSDRGMAPSTLPLNQNYVHDTFNNLTSRYVSLTTTRIKRQTARPISIIGGRTGRILLTARLKHSPLAYDP